MSISISPRFYLILPIFLCLAGLTSIPPAEAHPDSSDVEMFMWTGASTLMHREPKLFENLLQFAKRQNIIPYSAGFADPEQLDAFLKRCKQFGHEETWIEIKPRPDETNHATIRQFIEQPARREQILERFRQLARIYKTHYPHAARITLFDEAPLGDGFSYENTETDLEDWEVFKKYGPAAFAYLYKAVKEVMPVAEVGIFLHHPFLAPPEVSGRSFINDFMREAAALDAQPDFIYSDIYRGYRDRYQGIEETNKYIREVVSYINNLAADYDAEAYHLAQAHTIKVGYTPSRWALDTNVEAMLAGHPDGVGWYWPNYASTNYERDDKEGIGVPLDSAISVDPFIPNSWGRVGPAGSLYGTSRDRLTYAYLRVKEATGDLTPRARFDLWLYGYDFDHVEHKVSLKSSDGTWEVLGYINPQQDARGYEAGAREAFMYSYNDMWHAIVFHGLRRERFLRAAGSDREITLKIETPDTSNQSKLKAVYAMPYRATRNYLDENEVTALVKEHPHWVRLNSLAHEVWRRPVRLQHTLRSE